MTMAWSFELSSITDVQSACVRGDNVALNSANTCLCSGEGKVIDVIGVSMQETYDAVWDCCMRVLTAKMTVKRRKHAQLSCRCY